MTKQFSQTQAFVFTMRLQNKNINFIQAEPFDLTVTPGKAQKSMTYHIMRLNALLPSHVLPTSKTPHG